MCICKFMRVYVNLCFLAKIHMSVSFGQEVSGFSFGCLLFLPLSQGRGEDMLLKQVYVCVYSF